MTKIFLTSIILSLVSCVSSKALDANLPKDIAQMPPRDYSKKRSPKEIAEENLRKLKTEIMDIIATVPCTKPKDWRISPLGSKACGGPAEFIAYPILKEAEILTKLSDYNRQSSLYNLKYGDPSDCSVVPAPAKVVCEGAKPKLVDAGIN